jgi:hypothetical protein
MAQFVFPLDIISAMQRKHFKLFIRLPFLAALAISLLALWQHQAIHDWTRLRGYDPPSSVVQLADELRFTPQARKLFYINHPAIEDRESFNESCSNKGERTIVLGCYHPVDKGIFIFDVSDPRLTGVDQVTAAHEMLHVAYDRLSSRERARVDKLLTDYFDYNLKNNLDSERIKKTIAAYQKTEPDAVVNEMHSIFGTELGALPTDLENYYRQYFIDRSRVVTYANDYLAEFTSRQAQVDGADARLVTMRQEIDVNTANLSTQESQITGLRRRLDNDRESENFEAYNANVPVYNARIDTYNKLITSTRALIISYNRLVEERNELALQVADLAHSIDSTFRPIQQK